MKTKIAFFIMLFLMISSAFAQVTTSKIKGVVKDKDGPMMGAEILVVHTPTGTRNGTISQENGSFLLSNLRIGGPYKVLVKYVGYQSVELNNIFLKLGETTDLKIQMQESSNTLNEVVLKIDRSNVFSKDRTGAQTSIGHKELEALPTISRSAADFYRLEPSASNGSFGGRNDQYNNFSLNGSVFNNPFGLDAATPGGQSNAQPISLDAIDQIQVSVAPYDVTQSGFTGAAVNAVTKSGTNEFHGTIFGYFRNKDMTGKVNLGNTALKPDLSQLQGGISIGGPIIKDKLFFFANFERDDRNDLGSYYIAKKSGRTGDNVSRVSDADLKEVSQLLKSVGYNTGAYEGYMHDTYSHKYIGKVDWNISDNFRASFIYNHLTAYRDLNAHPEAVRHRGPDKTVMQFENSGYRINNIIDSFLTELNWGSDDGAISNKFQAGYTHFDDYRNPKSTPAPVINIVDDQGASYIIAGHEPFSIHNTLDQKVLQASDILTYTMNKHTLTLGANFEKFSFNNSSNLFGYGFDIFGSYTMQQFRDSITSGYIQQRINAAKTADASGKWNVTKMDVGQLGFFAQDEFQINDNFKLTLGLRGDKPMYFNTKEYVEEKIKEQGTDYIMETVDWYDENGKKIKMSARNLPSTKILWSPRLGFNLDVFGDKSMQLRGGTGLFTGRLPFVWLGNHLANVGRWYMTPTAPDFKFPQVWRSSIGMDYNWKGWITSIDAAYTKDINGMMVRNYGLKTPSGTLNSPVDHRPIYTSTDHAIMPDFGLATSAYTFTNTDKGYSYNFTVKISRNFENGLHTSLAYNFQDSQDVNSIEAEITGDAFDRNPALGNVNKGVLSPSLYGDRHRFVGYTGKEWKYGKEEKYSTGIAVFYEVAQGGRFSYTYSGDINGDGSSLNDLIYIPTESQIDQMTFSGSLDKRFRQRQAFNNFIKQDKYLNAHRGKYMGKYAAISPWRTKMDLKITQSYKLNGTQKIQFNINLLNFPNLLNKDWGVTQLPTNRQPIGVDTSSGSPVYSFDTTLKHTFFNDYSMDSRWQLQAGLRYSF